jgi:site-specific DNA recombinase
MTQPGERPQWAQRAIDTAVAILQLCTVETTTTQARTATTLRHGQPVRAAIYVRISHDRTGAGLGIARQEEDCRALCARKGWTVAGIYADNDVSAYTRKPRPEWTRLSADIRAGVITGIACWHVDRLTRSPRELEDVIDLAERNGVELGTATGEIDLSTPTGRLIARTLGAAARHESEHKAERQRRERRQAAEAGKPRAGGCRAYGYAADRVTIEDAEAVIIRECATRVLAGESLRSVTSDLNARGIRTTTGRQWGITALKNNLTSARISGRREYHGDILADQAWPPIITPDQSDQLRAMLTRPERRNNAGARTYLLSGILRCGTCGAGLVGRRHEGNPRYVCNKVPGSPHCGTMTIYAARADDEVTGQILTALSTPKTLARLMRAATGHDPDASAVTTKLRAVEERRDDLAATWAAGEISRKEWSTARRVLDDQVTTLTRQLSRNEHARALTEFTTAEGDLWARWENFSNGARRAVITAAADHITVTTAGTKQWNPDRITITWRA